MEDETESLADTPLLVLIHGTGQQYHDPTELYWHAIEFGVRDDLTTSDEGDQWWQMDGSFCRRLAERIRTKDRRSLTERNVTFRLKWSGRNRESARDEAACDFISLYDKAGRRPLHVIAHSHGGNIVRAAIERLAREKKDVSRVGTVISMGTPFFTYTRGAWLRSTLATAATAGTMAWLAFLSFAAHREAGGFAAAGPWKWALVPAGMFCAVVGLLVGLRLFGPPRKGRSLGLDRPVRWFNLCSRNDEAIQLLASFNRRVPLSARLREKGEGGLVWAGMGMAAYALSFTIVSIAALYLRLDLGPEQFSFIIAWGVLGMGLFLGLDAIWRSASAGASNLLDGVLSGRLRALAFGDDRQQGIAGVSTVPWPDHPDAHVALSEAVEAEIEALISASTAGMWAKVRRAIAPNATFLEANFGYLIDEVLTGDELAHTVYYRVDAFVDLVADLLVASGDYVRHGAQPDTPQPIAPIARAGRLG